ncbi:hypothetical protein RRG08_002734 [Elysia crispata]|uniref:Integrase catalytic domain-containing protein n=1 Tax=Elysia crispata TaxID=231223 RepID=A0AAE1CME2_9GAST|nr:hypothetical protein RRG08_002734 [Elysia crispata]
MYCSWPVVFRSEAGAEGLVRCLRNTFVTFGVPEVLTSDGGPQFTARKSQVFFKPWGVYHRLPSVAPTQLQGRSCSPNSETDADGQHRPIRVVGCRQVLADNVYV